MLHTHIPAYRVVSFRVAFKPLSKPIPAPKPPAYIRAGMLAELVGEPL